MSWGPHWHVRTHREKHRALDYLRDIMIAEIKLEQKQLGVMTKNLSQFVNPCIHSGEVVATL
ncbi:MAG: hypothetical protein CM1200mP14_25160 [Gammaproteobacteria bacterium]|nr:MAG: hypothetical protein CM1200mP14_25160 [Gammaproteobacteria bacterium]